MITLNPYMLAILVSAVFGAIGGFGKWLISAYDRRMSERHEQLAAALKNESERIGRLQRSFDELRVMLPMEYVRREDWIRFSASIDTKLDRLADLVQQTRFNREQR